MAGGRAKGVMERATGGQADKDHSLKNSVDPGTFAFFPFVQLVSRGITNFHSTTQCYALVSGLYNLLLVFLHVFVRGQKKTKGSAVIYSPKTQPSPAAAVPLTVQLTHLPVEGTHTGHVARVCRVGRLLL